MKNNITFISLIVACGFLTSCAATGVLVTVGAFSPVVYEEVRLNKPGLKLKPLSAFLDENNMGKNIRLPGLNSFSKDKPPQLKSKNKTSFNSNGFGFDCSKVNKGKNNTECFNQFSDSSYKKINKVKTSKAKHKKSLASQRKAQSDSLAISNVSIANSSKTSVPPIASLFINNWVKAWKTQNINKYLSFYSKNFKGDKSNHKDWKASRKNALVGKNKHISINLHSIQSQKNKNFIELTFIQDYSSNKHSDTGVKVLVLEKNKNDWKIVKETWVQGKKITKNSSIKPTKFINGELSEWLKAWAKQDVNTYLSFYSDQFKDSKHDLAKWQDSRKRALEENNNLSIEASNVKISESLNKIKLNFTQLFKSDKYSDVGVKELIWIKSGGHWKILKESWINS
jgi:murein L,D-transpeptidase YafK